MKLFAYNVILDIMLIQIKLHALYVLQSALHVIVLLNALIALLLIILMALIVLNALQL